MPNCPTCGQSFEREYGVKQHHAKTHGESLIFGNTECAQCGTELEDRRLNRSDKHFCNRVCQGKYWSENLVGQDGTNWRGGKIQIECEVCGTFTDDYPSRIERGKRFCSQECMHEWHRTVFVGEGHPRWNGGYPPYKGHNWYRNREKALVRDQYRCQICRKTARDMGQDPDVHHIQPIATYEDLERANDLNNLIALCKP